MADDEVIDPLTVAREKCTESDECKKLRKKLNVCTKRVTANAGKTEETCFEEVLDLVQCVDHCATRGLFSKLK